MNWNKILIHLKFFAQELRDTGYTDESEYITEVLIPKIEGDRDKMQVIGKAALLALVLEALGECE